MTSNPVENVMPQPDGYAYRYPDGYIRHSGGRETNGSQPVEALPWYYASSIAPLLAERDLRGVATGD